MPHELQRHYSQQAAPSKSTLAWHVCSAKLPFAARESFCVACQVWASLGKTGGALRPERVKNCYFCWKGEEDTWIRHGSVVDLYIDLWLVLLWTSWGPGRLTLKGQGVRVVGRVFWHTWSRGFGCCWPWRLWPVGGMNLNRFVNVCQNVRTCSFFLFWFSEVAFWLVATWFRRS